MRRSLCLLPVLALVACQADFPTEVDDVRAARLHPGGTAEHIVLPDPVVDTAGELLEFVVINTTFSDCWWLTRLTFWTRDSVSLGYLIPYHTWSSGYCDDPYHWVAYRGDGATDDLLLHFDGGLACSIMRDADVNYARLYYSPWSLGENFTIRCPYLNGD